MPSTEEVMKMLEHESYTNLAALTGADAEQLRREAAERIMTQLKTIAAFNEPEPEPAPEPEPEPDAPMLVIEKQTKAVYIPPFYQCRGHYIWRGVHYKNMTHDTRTIVEKEGIYITKDGTLYVRRTREYAKEKVDERKLGPTQRELYAKLLAKCDPALLRDEIPYHNDARARVLVLGPAGPT